VSDPPNAKGAVRVWEAHDCTLAEISLRERSEAGEPALSEVEGDLLFVAVPVFEADPFA